MNLFGVRKIYTDLFHHAAHPTNRIFKCVIAAELKGTVRQFRGAKAVMQFSMYVAKISLAAKIQSNTLAKHYLYSVYIYYS